MTQNEYISENILTIIFEQSPISTQIFSPEGTTIKVNKAWEQLWGLTLETIKGYNVLKDTQLVDKGIMSYIKKGFSGETTTIPAIKYEPDKTIGNVGSVPFRYVRALIYPIKNQKGDITEIVLQHEDITENKLAEEHLAENEKRFRALIENNSDAIAVVSPEGMFTYVSPTVKKVLGYRPEELVETSANLLFPKDDIQRSQEKFRKVVENPDLTVTVEHAVVHKNGSIIWLESTITNHINTPGINAYVSNFRDITARKKAEEAQAQLAAIIESSDDTIISKTLGSIITSWNKSAEKMFGYTAKEAIGKHIFLIIPTEHRKEENTIIAKLRKGEHIDHFETVRMRKDGTKINVSLTISPVKDKEGNIIGASKIARDITEIKRAHDQQEFLEKLTTSLTQSLDEYVTLSEIAKLIVPSSADYCRIAVIDENHAIREIAVNHKNPKKVQLTKELYDGYVHDASTVLGVPHILRTGKPEILSKVTEGVMNKYHTNTKIKNIVKEIGLISYMGVPLIARGKIIGAITFSSTSIDRIYTKDDLRFVQEIANRIALTIDNERLYKEAMDEIMYRKKVEALLQEREQRIRTIWESASDAIVVSDKAGIVIDANPAYFRLYGYTPTDVVHKNFAIIFPENQQKQANKEYQQLFKNEKIMPSFEAEIIRSNGEKRIVESRYGFIMNNGKREAMVSIIRDITERKQLEQRKNEFISVASHELKTPVTSIKVYAQVLHKRFLQGGDTRSAEHLAKMDAQLTKLTNLIIDLLDISKIESGKLQFSPSAFLFDDLVQEITEEMQRITTRHDIQIKGKTNKHIFADRERVGQVMINFISNAIKYSPEANTIVVHITTTETNVQLCVEDFGVGIPNEKQERVFERFYRVSGPREDTFPGLGLGLYISSEIIKRQDGKIWVESEEGEGSKFCFSLPITLEVRDKK